MWLPEHPTERWGGSGVMTLSTPPPPGGPLTLFHPCRACGHTIGEVDPATLAFIRCAS